MFYALSQCFKTYETLANHSCCDLFLFFQLLGGSRTSVNDLKELAARQQQEIAAKEKELKARQVQLMAMKRKSQSKPQNPYIQQLSAKADEQDKRLKELRHVQDQVDSYKLSNSALGRSWMLAIFLTIAKRKLQAMVKGTVGLGPVHITPYVEI